MYPIDGATVLDDFVEFMYPLPPPLNYRGHGEYGMPTRAYIIWLIRFFSILYGSDRLLVGGGMLPLQVANVFLCFFVLSY